MTQWIEETLVKYSEAYKKLEAAYDAVEAAKLSMQKVLYHNTEPIKLTDKYTITTPEDLRITVSGTIIMIGGVEWMHQGIHWVSSYGGTRTHDEMFVAMLRRHNQVSLLHEGC